MSEVRPLVWSMTANCKGGLKHATEFVTRLLTPTSGSSSPCFLCQELLAQDRNDTELLSRVTIRDETWVHVYDAEKKNSGLLIGYWKKLLTIYSFRLT